MKRSAAREIAIRLCYSAELAELAREERCAYIILPESKTLVGRLQDREYEEFARMHGYVIYKDATVDLYYFLQE